MCCLLRGVLGVMGAVVDGYPSVVNAPEPVAFITDVVSRHYGTDHILGEVGLL